MDVADMAAIIVVQRVAEWVERQLQHFQHQLQQLVHNQLLIPPQG
jgi:conjugal transfer/entry exclusion protein